MSLEQYRLDDAFTEGVDIRLDEVPDHVFRVVLPSMYLRPYAVAMADDMAAIIRPAVESDDAGEGVGTDVVVDIKPSPSVRFNPVEMTFRQQEAFFRHCVKSMDGEPVPADFLATYPQVVTMLREKANELAEEINERVAVTVKKSPASSDGSGTGMDAKTSTGDSKKRAG